MLYVFHILLYPLTTNIIMYVNMWGRTLQRYKMIFCKYVCIKKGITPSNFFRLRRKSVQFIACFCSNKITESHEQFHQKKMSAKKNIPITSFESVKLPWEPSCLSVGWLVCCWSVGWSVGMSEFPKMTVSFTSKLLSDYGFF